MLFQRLTAEWMSDHREMNEEQAEPGFGAQNILWFPILGLHLVTV